MILAPLARFLGRPKAALHPPFWSVDRPIFDLLGEKERIGVDFDQTVEHAYKHNGVIWTCVLVRLQVFSQARFQFQRLRGGQPGDLFGTEALTLLETPWPNGTTGELLARMEQDVSVAGNFYATVVNDRDGRRVRRLRPDWVTIVSGSRSKDRQGKTFPHALDARVVSYIYDPPGQSPEILDAADVVHWSLYPDPIAHWRGMSWLTPVVREIQADSAATLHKRQFFRHGATTNFVVKYDANISKEAFDEFVADFKEKHEGAKNAYRTMHLGGGADIETVGTDLRQLEFKATQGAGETRVAAASGVGAIIAQFSEGMQGSALNAGNYGAARRRFSDITMQHNWQSASSALAKLVEVPSGSRLWFDANIPFLQDDAKDAAEIRSREARTIREFIEGGFTPESAVEAVTNDDFRRLVHTGRTSVQLQDPEEEETDGSED